MLTSMISRAMRQLSRECVHLMDNREKLETRLVQALGELSYCKHLYVMDASGNQIVDNITRNGPDAKHFARNRASRPYMQGIVGTSNFRLSEAYISRNTKRPSLTAIRVIRNQEKEVIGFLGADYDLRELPATQGMYDESQAWRQIKGDPTIRSHLFQQVRVKSQIDEHIDQILPLMTELICHHGIFHCKLHFSSNRATIWLMDNPFGYRLLDIDDLLDPDICLAYPHWTYTKQSKVPEDKIPLIFEMFKELRFADENIYLRAGSINICNGMVALNFSCDGSHYIRWDDFLKNGLDFWFGALA